MNTTLTFKSNEQVVYNALEPEKKDYVYAELVEDYQKDGSFTIFGTYYSKNEDESRNTLFAIKTTKTLEDLTQLQKTLGITETDFDKLYVALKKEGAKYTLNQDKRFGVSNWIFQEETTEE